MRRSFACARTLSVAIVIGSSAFACKPHPVELEPTDDISRAERKVVQEIADAALRDVRALLPDVPARITLEVARSEDVIPETGEGASARAPNRVSWVVEPKLDLAQVARTQLRKTLFHELHHLARDRAFAEPDTLMDLVVMEGLATAFERDAAGADVPWGRPPAEAEGNAWIAELMKQPANAPRKPWLIRHPDGRRWIGMRAGTLIADRAARASGKSAAQLIGLPTADILRLAGVR